ncbi:YitT family protein [bacterium]|nr:YitT family protein [candidate division CSSED10-310 bacterium]
MSDPKTKERVFDYVRIGWGLALTAAGLDLFLIPNKIAAGGISGVATILYHLMDIPVGGSMLIMNIILFTIGFKILGKGFGAKTIVASIGLSVLIDGLTWVLPVKRMTEDLLIASIFGNLMTGMGMAIIFDRNASTGGTDIIARILNRYSAMNIGRALLAIDFTVAAAAGISLNSVDVGMYSLLSVLINCYTIDAFVNVINVSRMVLIISTRTRIIAAAAMDELRRGGTFVPFEGAFTGNRGDMLMMVIRPRQTARLRELVRRIDPRAFVIVSNVNRVAGEGFKSIWDPSGDL